MRKAYNLLKRKITGNIPSQSQPATQERQNRRYTIFDIGTEAAFTQLEPIKITGGLSFEQPRSSTDAGPGAILVTTVIDMKSYDDLSTAFERVRIESG